MEKLRDFIFGRELELNCMCQQVVGVVAALEERAEAESAALARRLAVDADVQAFVENIEVDV